ncbi:MAG: NusG domain II-containing protein, partial [Tyzzerella sp.]|nr:NusG domain II-containing protein [Tyzzerella sp.]
MKKNDILLAIGIFLIAIAFMLMFWKIGSVDVGNVTVTMNGQLVGTYSLKKDQEIPIGETN